MSTHKVDILDEQTTTGASLGLTRVFVPRTSNFACRMIPVPPNLMDKLGVVASEMPHQMFSVGDPKMTERNRVKWLNTVFRMKQIPINPHGQNRFWVTTLVMKTEDNGVPIVQAPQELP